MNVRALIEQATHEAYRYECQLRYAESKEQGPFTEFLRSGRLAIPPGLESWITLIRNARARGVTVRRVRVIDEPLNDYLRWEMALAVAANIPAGEDIRVLPLSSDARSELPDHDFWMIDGRVLRMSFGTDAYTTSEVLTTAEREQHRVWRDLAWNNSREWHGDPEDTDR